MPKTLEERRARSCEQTKRDYAKHADKRRASARERYWRKREAGWVRRDTTLAKHGLTSADRNRMLEEQGYHCKVCPATDEGLTRGLFVDHCHATGRVRGLLCSNCNTALGLVKDNPARLRALAEYLEFSEHG